jgi:hypothetical protein
VTFIGLEQRGNVEGGRWFDGWQWWVLQCIGYGSGGETEGQAIARRGRGGGKLISVVVVCCQPASDDDLSGCGSGEKMGWLGQLSLSCWVKGMLG